MTFSFTSHQKACLATGQNMAVTAGAGSGKTRVLVEKYLTYLDQMGAEGISHILAITFTNKAALEMIERVRKELLQRIQKSTSDDKKWRRIREIFDNAYISTIHSFCARLIREHPLDAQVDPRFQILHGPDQRLFIQKVMQASFLKWERNRNPHFLELLEYYD
ncbi:MAG: hypothetical protein D6785_14085, partial [Planctomycetota bacterium]